MPQLIEKETGLEIMNSSPLHEQVQLFKSVFKGREDVFAIRWEKGSKSGYMPASVGF